MEDLGLNTLFDGVYRDRSVLITGHTGFKGSWLALWLHTLGARVAGFSLPDCTVPSHYKLLDLNIQHFTGDIRDVEAIAEVVKKTKPEIIFHLAAQSLVRESYRNPIYTYQTNVIGTLNLLEAVRNIGTVKALVNITTDKVYENQEWHWPYRENDVLGGFDLYSSSKACSEILTSSYRNSFFSLKDYTNKHHTLIATARAGNVIGGGDWAKDRLVPDIMRATEMGEAVEIRYPNAVRPWEHVLEPLSGYLLLGQHLLRGSVGASRAFNFGPTDNQALSVAAVLNQFSTYWPKLKWRSENQQSSEFHEAGILKLDCSLAQQLLLWKSVWGIEKTLKNTADWYREYYDHKAVISIKQLLRYIEDAKEQKAIWS
jgi:CDP-glucose 4,6-dehydratase